MFSVDEEEVKKFKINTAKENTNMSTVIRKAISQYNKYCENKYGK